MEEFRDYVPLRLEELNKTVNEFVKAVGCGRSTYYNCLADNRWPEYGFDRILAFLEAPFTTKTEAEERYEFGHPWRKSSFEPEPPPPQTALAAALAALEPEKVCAGEDDQREPRVRDLFTAMGEGDFVGITTRTVCPTPFSVVKRKELVDVIYLAMDRGAMFAFVVPTAADVAALARNFTYNQLHPYAHFISGFDKFRSGYEAHLLANGDSDPAGTAARRTQMFEDDEFPMTPCGRTISLIGHSADRGQVSLRVLERGPGSHGRVALSPQNQLNEDRVRTYLRVVLENNVARSEVVDGVRSEFVEEFVARMHGNRSDYNI